MYSCSVMSDSSAAEVDLGMRIGSRVRLIRTAGELRLGMAALQPAGQRAGGGSFGAPVGMAHVAQTCALLVRWGGDGCEGGHA